MRPFNHVDEIETDASDRIAQDKIKSEHWRDAHGVKIQKNINHKLGAKAEGVTRMKVLESIVLDIQRYREASQRNLCNLPYLTNLSTSYSQRTWRICWGPPSQ